MKALLLTDIQNDFLPGGTLAAANGDEVHVMGLATDDCVKFTALDAIGLGFQTTTLAKYIRGVDLNAGDCQRAFDAMRDTGIAIP